MNILTEPCSAWIKTGTRTASLNLAPARRELNNIAVLEVTDVYGRIIYNRQRVNAKTYNIQTKDWKPGIYIIRATDEKQTLSYIRIIKH